MVRSLRRRTACVLGIGGVACVALASCTSFTAEQRAPDAGDAAGPSSVSAYAAAVLGDRPVLFWRLGEVDGQRALDSTASQRDGAHETAGVRAGQPSLLANDPNPSVRITTGSSIARRAERALSFPRVTRFAVECWLQLPSKPTGTAVVVARMQEDKLLLSGYSLRVEGDGRVYFQRGEGMDTSVASNGALTLGAPHHVVGVFDGTAIRLYVDGAAQEFSNQGVQLDDRDLDFSVGRYMTGTPTLDALVDEVAVYDYALPADRVKAHFDIGAGR